MKPLQTKRQLVDRLAWIDKEINLELMDTSNEWWIALLKIRKEMLIKDNQDLLKGTSYDHGLH